MNRIAFLANGGSGIGMGHIMRCLALAEELGSQGCDICFISTEADGTRTIRSYGNAVANPADPYSFFKGQSFDLLIIDSYDVNFDFFMNFKSMVGKLGYIDDLNAFPYPVDLLINGNVYGNEADYQKHTPGEVLLVGTEYVLIRREFRELPSNLSCAGVKSILLLNGSTDTNHMCCKIADMLLSDESTAGLHLNIVVGQSSTGCSDLQDLACRYPGITLYSNPQSISRLMLESELAISAAGSTLYELCACGVPSLSFIVAENQVPLAGHMDKLGLIKCLGWHDKLAKEDLRAAIKALACDKGGRTAIHRAMRKLVDGYGAKRAAGRIMEIICADKEAEYGNQSQINPICTTVD